MEESNNLFKDAKFGDIFLTVDGRQAVFINKIFIDDDQIKCHGTFYQMIFANKDMFSCNENGRPLWRNANDKIVSKIQNNKNIYDIAKDIFKKWFRESFYEYDECINPGSFSEIYEKHVAANDYGTINNILKNFENYFNSEIEKNEKEN